RPARRAVITAATSAATRNCTHGCQDGGHTTVSTSVVRRTADSPAKVGTAVISPPLRDARDIPAAPGRRPRKTGHGGRIVAYPTPGAPGRGGVTSGEGAGAVPLKPTTRAQVDGHRFLTRRARHAVVARDVWMLHDPLKRQTTGLTVGVVGAVIGVAGAAVLALLDPAPDVDATTIMVGRDSGQMYVRAGETVHPVHNLASARLVLGEPAEPRTVRDADVAGTPRGGLLGIPGAPSALPAHRDAGAAAAVSWTVCDEVADAERGRPRVTATSIVAREEAGPGRDTGADEVVLAEQDGT